MDAPAFVRQPVEVWSAQVRELLDALAGIAYVAGGAARQIVMDDEAPPATDIDIFCYSKESNARERLQEMGYRPTSESRTAASFAARDWIYELPVQLIRPLQDRWSLTFGLPEAVLAQFSFTTEMFALTAREAIYTDQAIEDTRRRRLVLNNVTSPLMVAMRAVKYGAKGYSMAAADMQAVLDAAVARAGVSVG